MGNHFLYVNEYANDLICMNYNFLHTIHMYTHLAGEEGQMRKGDQHYGTMTCRLVMFFV